MGYLSVRGHVLDGTPLAVLTRSNKSIRLVITSRKGNIGLAELTVRLRIPWEPTGFKIAS